MLWVICFCSLFLAIWFMQIHWSSSQCKQWLLPVKRMPQQQTKIREKTSFSGRPTTTTTKRNGIRWSELFSVLRWIELEFKHTLRDTKRQSTMNYVHTCTAPCTDTKWFSICDSTLLARRGKAPSITMKFIEPLNVCITLNDCNCDYQVARGKRFRFVFARSGIQLAWPFVCFCYRMLETAAEHTSVRVVHDIHRHIDILSLTTVDRTSNRSNDIVSLFAHFHSFLLNYGLRALHFQLNYYVKTSPATSLHSQCNASVRQATLYGYAVCVCVLFHDDDDCWSCTWWWYQRNGHKMQS